MSAFSTFTHDAVLSDATTYYPPTPVHTAVTADALTERASLAAQYPGLIWLALAMIGAVVAVLLIWAGVQSYRAHRGKIGRDATDRDAADRERNYGPSLATSLGALGTVTVIAGTLVGVSALVTTPTEDAQRAHERAVEIISDAAAEQMALQHVDATAAGVDHTGTTDSSLSKAPLRAVSGDMSTAPLITGVAPDSGERTYRVLFDPVTGQIDFTRIER